MMRKPKFNLRKFYTSQSERWDILPRERFSVWRLFRAEQLFIGSFLVLIVIGTLGLHLVHGMYAPGNEPLGFIDALYTITSAVCITGLTVVNTATYFSFWGELWLLIFMQLGGLGVVVLSSFIILALGGRLSLRIDSLNTRSADIVPRVNRVKLIRDILIFTTIAELVGAVLLFIFWWSPDKSLAHAAWDALFHSVSAFCNAGFSTFSDNYTGQFHNAPILLITSFLVIFGSLGFLSMEELYRLFKTRPGEMRLKLSIHTRLVLWTTALLLVVAAVLFALFEWDNSHTLARSGASLYERIVNAFFMSATARTAGFSTVDYTEAHAATNFFTVLLMAIGGSPGSTAGGLKTTTVALLFLLAWSRFRGRPLVSIWGRTIPEETIQRAVGLFVFVFVIAAASTLVLTLTEGHNTANERLLPYMFEAASAFFTVGLSINDSATLTPAGKCISVVLMFLGRVGPLTFAAAIALSDEAGDRTFRYAKEDVVIG